MSGQQQPGADNPKRSRALNHRYTSPAVSEISRSDAAAMRERVALSLLLRPDATEQPGDR